MLYLIYFYKSLPYPANFFLLIQWIPHHLLICSTLRFSIERVFQNHLYWKHSILGMLLFMIVSYLRGGSFSSYCKYHSGSPCLEEAMILCNQLFQSIQVLVIRIQPSHTTINLVIPHYHNYQNSHTYHNCSFLKGSWFVKIKSDLSHSNLHKRVRITDFFLYSCFSLLD